MSKLSVGELANEFGMPSEEVASLLRQMDIPFRSHVSMLTDDQVARVRARWEREKRARAEQKAAPPPAARRRRTTAAAAPEPVPAPAAADAPTRRLGARSRLQIMDLHDGSTSSTLTRCGTRAIMPRTLGRSACSTVWLIRRRPSARSVRSSAHARVVALAAPAKMWCCQMVPKSIYVDRHIAVVRLGWAG